MSVKIIPFKLNKNITKNTDSCPVCLNLLIKEYKQESEIHECRACNLGVLSSNCSCYYEEVKILYITCTDCNTCLKCKKQMEPLEYELDICKKCNKCNICNVDLQYDYCEKKFKCHKCEINKREEEEKKEFIKKWKESSPNDKLNFCEKSKLLILAKKKNIKGRSKMSKDELINCLYDKVQESDFNCELKKCIDCNSKYIEWILDCNDGYCESCSQELLKKGKKIFLYVPYSDKEEAKKYGCWWNPNKKKWFFYDKNKNKEYIINKWKLVE